MGGRVPFLGSRAAGVGGLAGLLPLRGGGGAGILLHAVGLRTRVQLSQLVRRPARPPSAVELLRAAAGPPVPAALRDVLADAGPDAVRRTRPGVPGGRE